MPFFRQRATSTDPFSRLQKYDITPAIIYSNQFFEIAIQTAIILIELNPRVTLYTLIIKQIMMLHFLSHYTRQAYNSL